MYFKGRAAFAGNNVRIIILINAACSPRTDKFYHTLKTIYIQNTPLKIFKLTVIHAVIV